jgi:ribonuclease P protein component
VLAAEQRLRRAADFSAAVRTGDRGSRGGLVVHLRRGGGTPAPRAGFVVPRAVGSAVTRNKVRRRLRHLLRDRMDTLAPGTDLVVRVLPAAAGATYQRLGEDLDAAIGLARRRRRRPAKPATGEG